MPHHLPCQPLLQATGASYPDHPSLFVNLAGVGVEGILPSVVFPSAQNPPTTPIAPGAKAKVSSHPGPLHRNSLWPHL